MIRVGGNRKAYVLIREVRGCLRHEISTAGKSIVKTGRSESGPTKGSAAHSISVRSRDLIRRARQTIDCVGYYLCLADTQGHRENEEYSREAANFSSEMVAGWDQDGQAALNVVFLKSVELGWLHESVTGLVRVWSRNHAG